MRDGDGFQALCGSGHRLWLPEPRSPACAARTSSEGAACGVQPPSRTARKLRAKRLKTKRHARFRAEKCGRLAQGSLTSRATRIRGRMLHVALCLFGSPPRNRKDADLSCWRECSRLSKTAADSAGSHAPCGGAPGNPPHPTRCTEYGACSLDDVGGFETSLFERTPNPRCVLLCAQPPVLLGRRLLALQ